VPVLTKRDKLRGYERVARVIRFKKMCPISEVPDIGEIVKAVEHL